jgi:phosphoglycerate-specific signal transduction histidine kinase
MNNSRFATSPTVVAVTILVIFLSLLTWSNQEIDVTVAVHVIDPENHHRTAFSENTRSNKGARRFDHLHGEKHKDETSDKAKDFVH